MISVQNTVGQSEQARWSTLCELPERGIKVSNLFDVSTVVLRVRKIGRRALD